MDKETFNLNYYSNSQTNLDDLKGRLAYTHNKVLGIITDIKPNSPPEQTADNNMWNYPTTYNATIINYECKSNTVDLSEVTHISNGKYMYKKETKVGTYDGYYDICSPQIVSDSGGKRTRNKRRRQTRRKSKKGKSRRKQQRR